MPAGRCCNFFIAKQLIPYKKREKHPDFISHFIVILHTDWDTHIRVTLTLTINCIAMSNAYSLHIGLNNVDPKHYDGWDGQLLCCENDALFFHEVAEKAGITNRKLLLSSRSQGAEMPDSANLDKYLEQFSKTLKNGDFLLSPIPVMAAKYAI